MNPVSYISPIINHRPDEIPPLADHPVLQCLVILVCVFSILFVVIGIIFDPLES